MSVEYTHPDVLTDGVRDGWADQIDDPKRINWKKRQDDALIPFKVVGGRPVNPCAPTGIRYGRNELGHWGEQVCADAMVTATYQGHQYLLLVERADGHGWALPGGKVDPGEDPLPAAARELQEETGLVIEHATWTATAPRYVPDPRASDEAWMVTVLARTDLGHVDHLPEVTGADDARRAAWVRADTYETLLDNLAFLYHGEVFAAHRDMLAAALAGTAA